MQYLMLALRFIHIVSGVFWVGGGIFNAFFLAPAVAATGEAGQKMMGYMVTKGKMSVRISIAAVLTVLAGISLYWIDSGGLTSAWTTSATGWGFGIGGLFGLIGLGAGLQVGKSIEKLSSIAAAAQGKPSPDQMAQLKAVQNRLGLVSKISTAAQILALVCMATARYWGA